MNFIDRRTLLLGSITGFLAGVLNVSGARAANKVSLVLLAHDYTPGLDISQYWISEKYDGVRALWDGKRLRFRSGQIIAAPEWFTAKLPSVPLDGELWIARGGFDMLSGIVRRTKPMNDEWKRVNYMVFELPPAQANSSKTTFTERIAQIQHIVTSAAWPQLQAVEHWKLTDEAALQNALVQVVKARGEGLMLHRADAIYTTGRSYALLKLKTQSDEEAVVTGHIPGKGKYAGLTGALQVETPEGTRFKLGSGLSDEQRKNPPPVGSTVVYTYRDKTPTGVPRFATFVRMHYGM